MNKAIQKGFTLIELMIVVAIIGILAAVALPAYQDYIETTNTAKMNTHFEQAIRFVRSEYQRVRTDLAMQVESRTDISDDYDSAQEWVDKLNSETGNATAPEGGLPFDTAESVITGAIGLAQQGAILSADLIVTVTRPAYGQFRGQSSQVVLVCWSPELDPACN